jgi:tetratricopeptide (TPR) repeat protein
MSSTFLSIAEIQIPQEIVNSGDYISAENVLAKERVPDRILAERFYRLGNSFYSAEQNQAAEMAWQKSALLADQTPEASVLAEYFSTNPLKARWQTIGSAVLVIISLYVLVFTFFEREPELSQFSTSSSFSGEQSYWDEWWDTGRPFSRTMRQRFGAEELWPMLQRSLQDLFGSKSEELSEDVREKLKRWLELSESPHLGEGPTDYYALTARGLFEAREFESALSTLNDGLYYAETLEQLGKIYQDLGTVYYYKGYKLQPNGLARYDLKDVRNSIKSYETALLYGEEPYLYGNLGWGYYLLGDYSSSIVNSRRALALKPELNYARMNLGIVHLRRGDYELAFATYAALLENNPQLDEYEGGIRDLQELQQEFPGVYPFINFVMGQLYWQQGRHKEARAAWKKFLNQNFPQSLWKDRTRSLLKKMKIE